MMQNNHHYLVLTVLGATKTGALCELTRISKQCGCSILESKSATLGTESAMFFHFSGSWSAIAKLEAALPGFAQENQLAIHIKRTQDLERKPTLPYQIQIIAEDRVGILHDLASFLSRHRIAIETLDCETHTTRNKTQRVSINALIGIPAKTHIAGIREGFLSYCEDKNLDATLDPYR